MPSTEPMTLPRSALGMMRLNSGQVGISLILPLKGVSVLRLSRFFTISAMPKQPSAMLIRPTPSCRNAWNTRRQAIQNLPEAGRVAMLVR
ncbi:Uncharacterised protein [Bordetella ansorpii]|uniref:Uncharacterized protein n=1 Tax=Bordetella ansorpii TaxID=288768 RepID=A0A146AIR5_9BORD|nr:Uncharacterised protein [Bordetella ansorpii]